MLFMRCAFCHKLVLRWFYSRHKLKHTKKLADGQMTDHVTVQPRTRYQGSLHGIPRNYLHRGCRGITVMPEDVMRSYLANPFLYGSMFCCGCKKYIPYRELAWAQNGQCLVDYFRQLQQEYLRVHGKQPPRPVF